MLLGVMWENKCPSQELSLLYTKEALYHFSFAYPNCQPQYSCVLGPLLSKIRAAWTPALWQVTAIPISERATILHDWQVLSAERSTAGSWIKGWSRPGPEQNVTRFYHYLEWHTIKNFWFLQFFTSFSDRGWMQVTKTAESGTVDKGVDSSFIFYTFQELLFHTVIENMWDFELYFIINRADWMFYHVSCPFTSGSWEPLSQCVPNLLLNYETRVNVAGAHCSATVGRECSYQHESLFPGISW